MMEIVNISDRPRVIAATRQQVDPDGTVDVDDTLGRSLCEQTDVWARAGKPAESDLKADWVDYAAAQGVDRAEAEDMTKDELVDMLADEE